MTAVQRAPPRPDRARIPWFIVHPMIKMLSSEKSRRREAQDEEVQCMGTSTLLMM